MLRKRLVSASAVALAVVVLGLGSRPGATAPPAQAPAGKPVSIEMRVPPDAEVWFDGAKTTQTGTHRRYLSPALTPGRPYAYHVRVRWTHPTNGKVEESKRVPFHAGDKVRADFSVPGHPVHVYGVTPIADWHSGPPLPPWDTGGGRTGGDDQTPPR
jgi:uncharacterized protein (TIGR03000 family)